MELRLVNGTTLICVLRGKRIESEREDAGEDNDL
jgi:hypothetical protein